MSSQLRRRLRMRGATALVSCIALTCHSHSRPGDEPLLDLARELAVAESVLETSRLDFGTPDARDAMLDGWSIDERWAGGETFVWGIGESSRLRFWRLAAGRLGLRWRCRSADGAGPDGQRVEVLVNGAEAGELAIADEAFNVYELVVPGQLLRQGDNEVAFRYRHLRAPSPAGGDPRALAIAWDWLELAPAASPAAPRAELERASGDATLVLPSRQRLDYYVEVEPGVELRWDALSVAQPRRSASAQLRVDMAWGDESTARRTRVISAGSGAGTLRLPLVRRSRMRISLTALPTASAGDATLRWRGARLVRPARAVPSKGAPANAAAPRLAGKPRGIVIFLVDTLRPDRLGVYGHRRQVSPHLDAFAERAAVFERAYAQSGWTRPAVASLLTGLTVDAHGVRDRWDGLPAELPVLPELLRQAGYATIGISTNTNVSSAFGFARGFDTFVSLPPQASGNAASAAEVNRQFFGWLDSAAGERPFFAYLHTSEPHDPYDAAAPFHGRFASPRSNLKRPDPAAITAALAADRTLDLQRVRADLEDLYDEEIAANDAAFGDLLAGLRGRGLSADSLIVVVADHGEEFLEHGGWGHGHTLYLELLRVPLVIKLPDRDARGVRVQTVAQHVDILPTLLAAAGVASPPGAGVSLLPQLLSTTSAETVPRVVISQLDLGDAEVSSAVDDRLHLLAWSSPSPSGSRYQLFDLAHDPIEQRDRQPLDSIGVGFMRSRLRAHGRAWPAREAVRVTMDDLTAAELRALGYLR